MRNLAILTITLSLFTSQAFSGEVDKKLHNKCIYPTVMLFSKPMGAIGTGVVIKSVKQKDNTYLNLAATCAHILKMTPAQFEPPSHPKKGEEAKEPDKPKMIKPPRYEYTARIGKYEDWSKLVGYGDYECKVMAIDREKDVAMLTFVSKHELHIADLNFSPKLYIGNEVYRMGCGMSDPYRLDYGRITALDGGIGRLSNIQGTYRTSIPTIPGDSGGPVFHEYKVIGIAQAIRMIQTGPISQAPVYHLSYVIPLSRYLGSKEIKDYLNTVEEFKDLIQDPS